MFISVLMIIYCTPPICMSCMSSLLQIKASTLFNCWCFQVKSILLDHYLHYFLMLQWHIFCFLLHGYCSNGRGLHFWESFQIWTLLCYEIIEYEVREKPALHTWMEGGLDYIMLQYLNVDGIRTIGSVLGQSIALDYYVRQVRFT